MLIKSVEEDELTMGSRFGMFCHELRHATGESQRSMAKHLQVSAAFLSRVESGIQKPSTSLKNRILNAYSLSDVEKEELSRAVYDAQNNESVDIRALDPERRRLVRDFAWNLMSAQAQ